MDKNTKYLIRSIQMDGKPKSYDDILRFLDIPHKYLA